MENREFRIKFFEALEKLLNLLNGTGITDFFCGENRVLIYVYRNPDKTIYPSDLYNDLGFTKQRITSILNSLRKKGYILTEPDSKDGRKIIITMSQKGQEYFKELLSKIIDNFENCADEYGRDRLEASYYNVLSIIEFVERKKAQYKD